MCGGAPTSRVPDGWTASPGRLGPDWWSTAGLASSARSAVTSRCWSGCAAAGCTGCKEGCAEGECGACAVLVARPTTGRTGPAGPRSTPAWCRPPAFDDQEVVTAEGLGDARTAAAPGPARDGRPRRLAVRLLHTGLHLLDGRPSTTGRTAAAVTGAPGHGRTGRRSRATGQRRRARPGTRPTTSTGRTASTCTRCSGNLCRCTGYRPIRDAAYALGQPAADDPLLARLDRARAGAGRRPRSPARQGRVRPPGRPGRGARPAGRRTRTPGWWPGPPTGASS